jgi:FeS assembly SUF system regulator
MSDYAVVVLAELARTPDHAQSATEAATGAGLPQPTVRKLLKGLARAGLVRSERGALGGYRLGRKPASIRLQEIIEAFEGPVAVTACSASPTECSRSTLCATRSAWAPVNAALRRSLAEFTLADMLEHDHADHAPCERRSRRRGAVPSTRASGDWRGV